MSNEVYEHNKSQLKKFKHFIYANESDRDNDIYVESLQKVSLRELASKFGVSHETIRKILQRKNAQI